MTSSQAYLQPWWSSWSLWWYSTGQATYKNMAKSIFIMFLCLPPPFSSFSLTISVHPYLIDRILNQICHCTYLSLSWSLSLVLGNCWRANIHWTSQYIDFWQILGFCTKFAFFSSSSLSLFFSGQICSSFSSLFLSPFSPFLQNCLHLSKQYDGHHQPSKPTWRPLRASTRCPRSAWWTWRSYSRATRWWSWPAGWWRSSWRKVWPLIFPGGKAGKVVRGRGDHHHHHHSLPSSPSTSPPPSSSS